MVVPHAKNGRSVQEVSDLDFITTAIIFAAALALFAVSSWRASKPAEFGKVRMIPWTSLILVFAVITILMLVHLVNLAGFETGQNRGGVR